MEIPKKIYEKIDTEEVADYCNYPQINPQIKILGKNKGSCETYDTLLNIISDDLIHPRIYLSAILEVLLIRMLIKLRTATITRILGMLLSLILLKSYMT